MEGSVEQKMVEMEGKVDGNVEGKMVEMEGKVDGNVEAEMVGMVGKVEEKTEEMEVPQVPEKVAVNVDEGGQDLPQLAKDLDGVVVEEVAEIPPSANDEEKPETVETVPVPAPVALDGSAKLQDRQVSNKALAASGSSGTNLGMGSKGLSAKDATERLSEDEVARVRFLVRMRQERGLSEEEAQELKEFCFKILTGGDSENMMKSMSRGFSKRSFSLSRGLSRNGSVASSADEKDLGISIDERIEYDKLRRIKKKRPLTLEEEVKFEGVRQKMIDHAYTTNYDIISDILDSQEFSSRENSRKIPHGSEITEPTITLTPYGENYASDIFTISHNAIKREIVDLYTILASMKRRNILVDKQDLELFFAWWNDFYIFVVHCFDIEDKFVLPWVTRRVNVSKTIMQQTSRNLRRSKITYKLREISNATTYVNRMHPGEVISKVHKIFSKFFPDFMSYFADTERVLVPMVARAYTAADKKELEKDIFNYVKENDEADLVIGLWLRWMTSIQKKNWKRDVCGLFKGGSLKELEAAFEKREHIRLPQMVMDREKEVLKELETN